MAAQNTLRTSEENQAKKKNVIVDDVNYNALNISDDIIHPCATNLWLLSNIRTMMLLQLLRHSAASQLFQCRRVFVKNVFVEGMTLGMKWIYFM